MYNLLPRLAKELLSLMQKYYSKLKNVILSVRHSLLLFSFLFSIPVFLAVFVVTFPFFLAKFFTLFTIQHIFDGLFNIILLLIFVQIILKKFYFFFPPPPLMCELQLLESIFHPCSRVSLSFPSVVFCTRLGHPVKHERTGEGHPAGKLCCPPIYLPVPQHALHTEEV